MLKNKITKYVLAAGLMSLGYTSVAMADCSQLPNHAALTAALRASVHANAGGTGPSNGGLDVPMWATIVDNYGRVCAVATSTDWNRAPWPASRAISAQKAYTTNALTNHRVGGIWSTALLYTPTQPGQFLWGLHQSNPVNPGVVYRPPVATWGKANDPMVGLIPGGINTFGGGVSLWLNNGLVAGGVGVSGDTSCADHNIALRVRDNLVAQGTVGHNPAGQSIF